MSDNQSWNSSGSEEDIEPREEPGHHVGVVDLSGVLSKVSCFLLITPIENKTWRCELIWRPIACRVSPDRGVFRVFPRKLMTVQHCPQRETPSAERWKNSLGNATAVIQVAFIFGFY